ncbi:unnamed protein product [Amoebophrya sp. A25]|nr:unnamed protein product [Amoebophrya sp. A25]|eukprot:GSA25T00023723001.1
MGRGDECEGPPLSQDGAQRGTPKEGRTKEGLLNAPPQVPKAFKVGEPKLSPFELTLLRTTPLSYLSSIWWVNTQTGGLSLVSLASLRLLLGSLQSLVSRADMGRALPTLLATEKTSKGKSHKGAFGGRHNFGGADNHFNVGELFPQHHMNPSSVGSSLLHYLTTLSEQGGVVSFLHNAKKSLSSSANAQFVLVATLYFLANAFGTSKHTGYWRNNTARRLPLFRALCHYYPHRNVVTCELDPKKTYFFGMHPHGVLALTLAPTFAEGCGLESRLFPGLRIQVCTVPAIFLMPYASELSKLCGMITNDKQNMIKNLREGKSIANYVGGADEALVSGGGKMRVILKDRMGFVQTCVESGADLVPCLAFGETALYRQVFHPLLRRVQNQMAKKLPITLPLAFNCSSKHWNPIRPRRVPTYSVFGSPVPVQRVDRKQNPEGFRAAVADAHKRYIDALRALHAKWRHLGTAEDQELEILSLEESRHPQMIFDLRKGQEEMDRLQEQGRYDLRHPRDSMVQAKL